jgi:hypothetical protein
MGSGGFLGLAGGCVTTASFPGELRHLNAGARTDGYPTASVSADSVARVRSPTGVGDARRSR